MNLVLIGYRGTGKSTIGARLAAMLDMAYVSLDAEIAARAGMAIPEIVSRFGWKRFRDLEEEVAADAAARDGQVLDTGGGVVVRPENIRRLKERGIQVIPRGAGADCSLKRRIVLRRRCAKVGHGRRRQGHVQHERHVCTLGDRSNERCCGHGCSLSASVTADGCSRARKR